MNIEASGFNLSADDEPYRIHFTSPVVAPSEITDFPYICVDVRFAHIEFAAIVWASDAEAAILRIFQAFEKATVQSIEKGVAAIPADYGHFRTRLYGSLVVPQSPPWWKRMLGFRSS